jgi:hypothetical protein
MLQNTASNPAETEGHRMSATTTNRAGEQNPHGTSAAEPTSTSVTGSSPKRLARTAGALYLPVAVLGGWAHGYVRTTVHVPGDAAATANNVVEHASLVRYGVVADLAQATLMLFVVLALYKLLQHAGRPVARAMVVLVIVSTAITSLNMVNQLGAVLVATDVSYAAGFGADGSDALVLLLLDLQRHGYLIAQIFFGLWLFPLGLLAYRSKMFPRLIGIGLMVGAVAYLMDVPLQFLAPDLADTLSPVVLIPLVIAAEVSMLVYLLVKGVRSTPPQPALASSSH